MGEILAHQKISSSPTHQKTPPNPRSITYISFKSVLASLASSLSFFFQRQTDRRMFSSCPSFDVDAERGRCAAPGTYIARRHVIKESFGPHVNVSCDFLPCFCLHFACLITFSSMRSQPAIHCFGSGLHEPVTSHPHAKMRWHRWFHPNTWMRLLFLHAFMFPQLHRRFITLRAKLMFRKNDAHAFQRFGMHFPCTFSLQSPHSHIRQAMHA